MRYQGLLTRPKSAVLAVNERLWSYEVINSEQTSDLSTCQSDSFNRISFLQPLSVLLSAIFSIMRSLRCPKASMRHFVSSQYQIYLHLSCHTTKEIIEAIIRHAILSDLSLGFVMISRCLPAKYWYCHCMRKLFRLLPYHLLSLSNSCQKGIIRGYNAYPSC